MDHIPIGKNYYTPNIPVYGRAGHYFMIQGADFAPLPVFAVDAWNLDEKFDAGMPARGLIGSLNYTSSPGCVDKTASPPVYIKADEENPCVPFGWLWDNKD